MVIWADPAKYDLRAIHDFFASDRILYEIKSEKVYVIGIIHGRRDFTSTHVYRVKEP